MILNLNKRFTTALILVLIILILAINYFLSVKLSNHASSPNTYPHSSSSSSSGKGSIEPVLADEDYEEGTIYHEAQTRNWCSRVAGSRYLSDLASTWALSCGAAAGGDNENLTANTGSLVCFQAQVEEEPDNFCVARNAVYNTNPSAAKPIGKEDLFPEHGILPGGTTSGKKNTRPSRPFKVKRQKEEEEEVEEEVEEVNIPGSDYDSQRVPNWGVPPKQWSLNCAPKMEWAYGVQAPYTFRSYFSETGAGPQLRKFDMSMAAEKPKSEGDCKGSIMLVKLEGGGNIWHTLMEIWSAVLTLDTLEKAVEAREKLFGKGDTDDEGIWERKNVQVYIQENMQSEKNASPVFGLWSSVTGKEVKDVNELESGCYKSVILPLAGGANPFWKDHWKERRCTSSSLLDRFVEKVMAFYGVKDVPPPTLTPSTAGGEKVKVKIIGRKHNRKILKIFDYVRTLQRTYPDADIEIIKLEKMSVTEQLRMMRDTDVLIGVTGAGLTHTMFLRRGAAVVELTQPKPFVYFGFGNTARMLGLDYFSLQAEKREGRSSVNWQEDNVLIDENMLVKIVGKAVEGQKARKRAQR